MIKAFKNILIFIAILIFIIIGFFIFVLCDFIFSGGTTPKAALPTFLEGGQMKLYNIVAKKILDEKEPDVNSCSKEFHSEQGKNNPYKYALEDGKLIMSYYPYPWQKLYSKKPEKRSYTLDYMVCSNGRIIVFTYSVPHEHEWDKIGKDKDIMVTYSYKSVKDLDFTETYKTHFHAGEYVNKEELEAIKKKMSDNSTAPLPAPDDKAK